MYHNYVYFPGEGTSLNLLQVWHVLLRVWYYGPVPDRRICNPVPGMQNENTQTVKYKQVPSRQNTVKFQK